MDITTLALLLTRLGRLNEQFLTDHCRAHGTTPAELQVLMLLHHHRDEHLSPSAIGGFIVQTSGGLTATLRRLEEAGWIDRRPDPDDGRRVSHHLTEDGRSTLRSADRAVGDRLVAIGTHVHAGDSTRLIASLAHFGEAIRAARAAGTT